MHGTASLQTCWLRRSTACPVSLPCCCCCSPLPSCSTPAALPTSPLPAPSHTAELCECRAWRCGQLHSARAGHRAARLGAAVRPAARRRLWAGARPRPAVPVQVRNVMACPVRTTLFHTLLAHACDVQDHHTGPIVLAFGPGPRPACVGAARVSCCALLQASQQGQAAGGPVLCGSQHAARQRRAALPHRRQADGGASDEGPEPGTHMKAEGKLCRIDACCADCAGVRARESLERINYCLLTHCNTCGWEGACCVRHAKPNC